MYKTDFPSCQMQYIYFIIVNNSTITARLSLETEIRIEINFVVEH